MRATRIGDVHRVGVPDGGDDVRSNTSSNKINKKVPNPRLTQATHADDRECISRLLWDVEDDIAELLSGEDV
jgi:hypothetical protein